MKAASVVVPLTPKVEFMANLIAAALEALFVLKERKSMSEFPTVELRYIAILYLVWALRPVTRKLDSMLTPWVFFYAVTYP